MKHEFRTMQDYSIKIPLTHEKTEDDISQEVSRKILESMSERLVQEITSMLDAAFTSEETKPVKKRWKSKIKKFFRKLRSSVAKWFVNRLADFGGFKVEIY